MSNHNHERMPSLPTRRRPRRGVTAILAMMFLVIFTALGIGFYAAFTLGSQVSYNDREARRALAAAESGMEFARYHLWALNISYSTSMAELLDQVEDGLSKSLDGTANLKGKSISRVNNTIYIPGSLSDYITAGASGDQFRIEITQDGTNMLVTAYGRTATGVSAAQRGVQLRYAMVERPGSIYNFGVASRSAITLDSNAKISGSANPAHGSVLSTSSSATPVILKGNAAISGDVSLSSDSGSVSLSSSATIAGSSNPTVIEEHIHKGVGEPDFPTVDTDIYKGFATNVISTSNVTYTNGTLKNIYIKANSNPTFGSNMALQGVIYIETPNKVTFSSNTAITGAIVVQNSPTGDPSTNVLTFNSNTTLKGLEHLPETSDFPAALRALSGSAILAPTFGINFNSNFGTVSGAIVGSKISFDSNAYGTIEGNVINLDDTSLHFDSNARISIANPGTAASRPGMYFGSRYVPLPGSYQEVSPSTAIIKSIESEPIELEPIDIIDLNELGGGLIAQ